MVNWCLNCSYQFEQETSHPQPAYNEGKLLNFCAAKISSKHNKQNEHVHVFIQKQPEMTTYDYGCKIKALHFSDHNSGIHWSSLTWSSLKVPVLQFGGEYIAQNTDGALVSRESQDARKNFCR